MQRLLFFCLMLFSASVLMAQAPVFLDDFDDGTAPGIDSDVYSLAEADGELTITSTGTSANFDGFWVQLPSNIDVSANPTLFVRAKSAVFGTTMRVDLVDADGNFTNTPGVTVELTPDYEVYEFSAANDGGSVDFTNIQAYFVYFDPGVAGFTGPVAWDFVSIGGQPDVEVMSDIFQDHMDSDSSLASWVFFNEGSYNLERGVNEDGDSSVISINGLGTAGTFDILVYEMRSPPDYVSEEINITDESRVYVKARSNREGTVMRMDVIDADGFTSNEQGISFVLEDTFTVFEYDFQEASSIFLDPVMFPDYPCNDMDLLPCLVNKERVTNLGFYIDPGTGAFPGTIDIEYISFGTSLDPLPPAAPQVYADDFDNDRPDFTGNSGGYTTTEAEGLLTIVGDGTGTPFSVVAYGLHEASDETDTSSVKTVVDFTEGKNKFFMRARVLEGEAAVRVDLIDSTGLATNNAGLRARLTTEFQTFSLDFSGKYLDFGYGGAEGCSPETPCDVDGTIIEEVYFYINPEDGGFNGTIEVDWISVGQPLESIEQTEPGIANYQDTLANPEGVITVNGMGLAISTEGDVVTLTGDGSSPQFQQYRYSLRDGDGNPAKADLTTSDNKIYVRARLRNSVDTGQVVRIDVRDEGGFESTNAGITQTIVGEEWVNYVFDYNNANLVDGGYGGTSCSSDDAPCPVDPERVTELILYPAPNTGGFLGDIDIEWISFGQEIMESTVAVYNFAELEELQAFPNPAGRELSVQYDLRSASDLAISLYDGLGRRQIFRNLGTVAAGRNLERLDISELPVGTYHLQVMVNGLPARAVTVLKR